MLDTWTLAVLALMNSASGLPGDVSAGVSGGACPIVVLELVGEGGDQATACGVDWLRSGSLDQMAPGCC
jgi:hypothetical protein